MLNKKNEEQKYDYSKEILDNFLKVVENIKEAHDINPEYDEYFIGKDKYINNIKILLKRNKHKWNDYIIEFGKNILFDKIMNKVKLELETENNMNKEITNDNIKGQIDFAIITIREDEYIAVLERFKPYKTISLNRKYALHKLRLNSNKFYNIVITKCIEQGQGEAADITRDIIEDLDPKYLCVIGIAGGLPESEFTLGDVIVASRLHDFCVTANIEGGTVENTDMGGPMHKVIQVAISTLSSIKEEIGNWNSDDSIGMEKPSVDLKEENFYGNENWINKTKKSLEKHYGKDVLSKPPLVTSASVASSNSLIKDSALIDGWSKFARDIKHVEMELGGVYRSARRINKEYPILAIRGISDIIGFNRDSAWTSYACNSAAAFAFNYLKTEPFT